MPSFMSIVTFEFCCKIILIYALYKTETTEILLKTCCFVVYILVATLLSYDCHSLKAHLWNF